MVAPIKVKLKGKWKALEHKLTHPKFKRKLRITLPPAMEKSALQLQKIVRTTIRKGSYAAGSRSFKMPKNAPLTIAIKKSSKPLTDFGDLFAAVTNFIKPDGTEAFVGILQVARTRDGRSLANIAENLHQGIKITVTPKMRRMFYYLSLASRGLIPSSELTGRAAVLFKRYKKWKPLREDTTRIVIPGRPFLAGAFAHKPFHDKFRVEMLNAVKRALLMVR